MSAPPPPPRRSAPPSGTSTPTTDGSSTPTWKDKMKAKGSSWGKVALDKGIKISDNVGGRVNNYAEKLGSEPFWPTSGDFPKEMDKAARILRAFTVDGVMVETVEEKDEKGKKKGKKQQKVLRKIPPQVIAQAKGLAIFTSMRTAIAPFGGAGGAGIVVAKLPDGTWSAPSSMSPNNLSTGFMIGVDIYDAVLIIRTQAALDSFATHKATLGTDVAVVAGPFGAGAAYEAGLEKAPVLSYVRSRGMYAGVQIVGQVFVERFDENAAMYNWPGVKAGDVLAGKVKVPREAKSLQQALIDAESGKAQREKGDALDIVVPEGVDELELQDGEVLKLPPTPTQTAGHEAELSKRHLPPAYEGERHSNSSSPVPAYSDDKKRMMPPLPPRRETPPTAAVPAQEPMSDSERREWEQHEAQEELERPSESYQSQDQDVQAQMRQDEELARQFASQDLTAEDPAAKPLAEQAHAPH